MIEEPRALTEEELMVAFEGPAVSVNRCLISLGSTGVRMAFVEQGLNMSPKFRAAVVMPLADAISLKKILTTLLADIEKQIEGGIVSTAVEIKEDG